MHQPSFTTTPMWIYFTTIRNDCQHPTGRDLGPSEFLRGYNSWLAMSRGPVMSPAMNDQSTPPSPPLPEDGYRLRLNNWLQAREWQHRLTWERYPDGSTWHAVCRCPFHFSPRLLGSYLSPQLTAKYMVGARVKGTNWRRRRLLVLLSDASCGKKCYPSLNPG